MDKPHDLKLPSVLSPSGFPNQQSDDGRQKIQPPAASVGFPLAQMLKAPKKTARLEQVVDRLVFKLGDGAQVSVELSALPDGLSK